MIQNTEKSKEVLKAEQAVAQAKARLDEAKRKESQKKRESENRHKYMMGGIVHRYFPECEYSGLGVHAVRWLGNRFAIIYNTRNLTNIKPANAPQSGSGLDIGSISYEW